MEAQRKLSTFQLIKRAIRRRWYRFRYGLKQVHPTAVLSPGCFISPDFKTGAYCFINVNARICRAVTLGDYVMFGPNVSIVGQDHEFDQAGTPIMFSGRPVFKKTVIESDAWIGHGSTIMSGVKIGRGAIIAAGALVTKDVPPYEIHGGVPAKRIGSRFKTDEERQLHDKMLDQPASEGMYCGHRSETPVVREGARG